MQERKEHYSRNAEPSAKGHAIAKFHDRLAPDSWHSLMHQTSAPRSDRGADEAKCHIGCIYKWTEKYSVAVATLQRRFQPFCQTSVHTISNLYNYFKMCLNHSSPENPTTFWIPITSFELIEKGSKNKCSDRNMSVTARPFLGNYDGSYRPRRANQPSNRPSIQLYLNHHVNFPPQ